MADEATLVTGQPDTAPATSQPATVAGTVPSEGSQLQSPQDAPEGKAAAQAEAPATPVEYADFNLPEGYNLSGEVGQEFKAVAKELGLNQEQAQKLIDLDVKRTQAQTASMQQASVAWQEASKADKEFGGDKLAENVGLAKKALDVFGTPELKALLDQSGLGNHPEIVRAFYRAGKAISEDKLVTGGTGGSRANKNAATSLYPSQI